MLDTAKRPSEKEEEQVPLCFPFKDLVMIPFPALPSNGREQHTNLSSRRMVQNVFNLIFVSPLL